jgi:hypothetical protein
MVLSMYRFWSSNSCAVDQNKDKTSRITQSCETAVDEMRAGYRMNSTVTQSANTRARLPQTPIYSVYRSYHIRHKDAGMEQDEKAKTKARYSRPICKGAFEKRALSLTYAMKKCCVHLPKRERETQPKRHTHTTLFQRSRALQSCPTSPK